MELFERLMLFFFTPQCYSDIFLSFDFTNIECFKYAISKCLSYGIVTGSLLIRLPQILVIIKAKSGEGISLISELMMLVAVFGSMSYGYFKQFPVSSYGDSYFLFIQSSIVLLLILYYNRQTLHLLLALAIISTFSFLLYSNSLSESVILALNGAQMLLSLGSKFNQAFVNWRNASTGKLSAITLWLQFLGCVARIFTSIQETGDRTLVITYILVSLANGILVLQWLYYRKAAAKTAKKAKKTN